MTLMLYHVTNCHWVLTADCKVPLDNNDYRNDYHLMKSIANTLLVKGFDGLTQTSFIRCWQLNVYIVKFLFGSTLCHQIDNLNGSFYALLCQSARFSS